jgi:anti-anti-sigma regulatory factor
MGITVTVQQANEPIAVIKLTGEINASNYDEIIVKASEVYNSVAKKAVIDLSEVPSINSTGQVAIHKVALIFSGVEQDVEANENPDFTHSSNARKYVKLLSPQPEVQQSLEKAGFTLFFKIYNDLDSAVQSFNK